jgi:hypothetical protein
MFFVCGATAYQMRLKRAVKVSLTALVGVVIGRLAASVCLPQPVLIYQQDFL